MLMLSVKWPNVIWLSLLLMPISLISLYDMYQPKHAQSETSLLLVAGVGLWNFSDLFFVSTFLSLKPMVLSLVECSDR